MSGAAERSLSHPMREIPDFAVDLVRVVNLLRDPG
jgi:hypothetical protein